MNTVNSTLRRFITSFVVPCARIFIFPAGEYGFFAIVELSRALETFPRPVSNTGAYGLKELLMGAMLEWRRRSG
jgi:hypothetical protein